MNYPAGLQRSDLPNDGQQIFDVAKQLEAPLGSKHFFAGRIHIMLVDTDSPLVRLCSKLVPLQQNTTTPS